MSKRILPAVAPLALVAGIMATLETCSGSKPLDVKIKVGVVMKSGDVKNVARQDLIISKTDIIDLWETSKKNNRWTPDLIKNDTQEELGYDAKLNPILESIGEKNTLINQLRPEFQRQLQSLAERFYDHLKNNILWGRVIYADEFSDLLKSLPEPILDEAGLRAVDTTYSKFIGDVTDPEKKHYLETRYAEFKEIKNSAANLPAALSISKLQHELDDLIKDREKFEEAVSENAAKKDKTYFEKAKSDFLLRFKEVFVSVFKTDLNGEANVRIPKGTYYIFCSSEIGVNHITWDYAATIAKKGQYIELANDNAFSFKEEDTAQFLKVLYEALAKMEGAQPALK